MKTRKPHCLLHICQAWTLAVVPILAAAQSPASPPTSLPSADDASYTLGLNLGWQLHQNSVTNEISIDRIVDGLRDGLGGKKALPADQQQLQAFLRAVVEAAAARNAAAATQFLERNRNEKGVKTTPTGLQYRIIQAGNAKGSAPQPTDRVTVEYRGTFIDGTEFDNSAKHPSSAPLAVNNLIPGWQEALAAMKPGAKWEVFVPPELGYGQGSRPGIPGGSLLIFDLELKNIQPAPIPAPPKSQ